MADGRPPRLAELLLRFAVRGDLHEALAGDLAEEHRARVVEAGRGAARRWYWRQVLGTVGLRAFAGGDWSPAAARGVSPELGGEVRLAARRLRRSPGYSIVAILLLALGIGAVAACYTLVRGVVLRPLPFPDAERLVVVSSASPRRSGPGPLSLPDAVDLRAASRTLDLAFVDGSQPLLAGSERSERVHAAWVTAGYFDLLGFEAAAGRLFTPEDESTDPAVYRRVVLTWSLWQRRFGGDPGLIGSTIQLSGYPNTVVGVLSPAAEALPLAVEGERPLLFRPWPHDVAEWGRSSRNMRTLARLRPGVDLAAARREVAALAARLEGEHPETNSGQGLLVHSLRESLTGEARTALLFLLAAAAAVLGIAVADLASLALVRAVAGRRDLAIRRALGAGRARLALLPVVEGTLLAVVGGLGAAVVAVVLGRLLVATAGASLPLAERVRFDGTAVAVVAALTLGAALLLGLLPWLAGRGGPGDLHRGRGLAGASPAVRRAFQGLVVGQVAAAVVLLGTAGLFLSSLDRLLAVDDGLEVANAWAVEVEPPASDDAGAIVALYERLRRQAAAVPGVGAVGTTSILPLSTGFSCDGFTADDRPPPADGEGPCAETRIVSGDYFAAVGTPLHAGRRFDERDGVGGEAVAIVNRALARAFWPDGDVVGRSLTTVHGDVSRRIVGVVDDARIFGPRREAPFELFIPLAQELAAGWGRTGHALVVRTAAARPGLPRELRGALATVDREVAIGEPIALAGFLDAHLAPERLRAGVLGAFAGSALLLAVLGLYGTLAYTVRQRRREIGIRAALGADRGRLRRWVLIQGMALVAVGLALGLAVAAAAGRAVESLLFGVHARDPGTWLAGSALLAAAALVATALPARRAAGVDPAEVLREE